MSEPLTVVCWKWEGWRPSYYTPDHVHALSRMLKKHLKRPHRLVCITDKPEGITECETYPIWDDKHDFKLAPRDFNCYRRLRIFTEEVGKDLGPIIVSMDLDMVILSDITDMFAGNEDFKILEGTLSKYNGSMFMLRAGTHAHLWYDLPQNVASQTAAHGVKVKELNYGSDQAWISMKIPCAPVWTAKDGVHTYRLINGTGAPAGSKIVYFSGMVKPWNGSCKFERPELHATYMRYYDGEIA